MVKFRTSRWRFFPGYLLSLILLGLSIWFFDSGRDAVSYIFAGGFIILFLILELATRAKVLEIGDAEVILRQGIFSVSTKRAHYEDITDTGVHQTLIQRIFNYGNIGVSTSGTKEVEIVMRSMLRPFKAEKLIREQIQKHRRFARAGYQEGHGGVPKSPMRSVPQQSRPIQPQHQRRRAA